MSEENIIRAWKEPEFRNHLSDQERKLLPDNPAGIITLTDTELSAVGGGLMGTPHPSFICSHGSRC